MVIAPFAHIGQNGQANDQGQISSKQARARLRSALPEGRWSGIVGDGIVGVDTSDLCCCGPSWLPWSPAARITPQKRVQ